MSEEDDETTSSHSPSRHLRSARSRKVKDMAALTSHAVRFAFALRGRLSSVLLSTFLNLTIPLASEAHARLSSFLYDSSDSEDEVEVNVNTSRIHNPPGFVVPELEVFFYLLVLIFLIDQKRYYEAKACCSIAISLLKNIRTVDRFAARLYFYYSLCYELTGDLAEIRGHLLALYQLARLRRDQLSQEMLLNLLLRNYLHYNLYDQAEKLRSKAPPSQPFSNQQLCRYLFYHGRIRTIQLEYTDAKELFLQAARKAPVAARGFQIQCNKWAVIVRLLLGEIPERSVFTKRGMVIALSPYFELTNAVRIGDLELFRNVAVKFATTFNRDRTHNLIVRLRPNVIRSGLRNISMSYSRISLTDVAKKLGLNSDDAEMIVAKAIRDGAIDASLDHANGWMLSKETRDVYSTNEPLLAFNSRIAFCFNLHNEAVRAMHFPSNIHDDEERYEERRERQQEQERAISNSIEDADFF